MTICTRPGCGVDFDPSSPASSIGPCSYHPGAPVFHEGSKSWSCCRDRNKPVLEFDEFMLIAGCTTADAHTSVKQAKTTFGKKLGESDGGEQVGGAAATLSSQATPAAAAPSVTPMSSSRIAAIQKQNEQRTGKSGPGANGLENGKTTREEEDPSDVKIAEGAQCKRAGCKATFAGGQRDRSTEQCRYHSGVPIFHEGSKGYACCKRRVLEFDEFLTIEPCSTARTGHLFVGGTSSIEGGEEGEEERADCRIDHYETPNDVRVTVYAKGVEMDRSKIVIQEEQVDFSLGLPPASASATRPRRYVKALLPYAEIDADASSFTVSRFKIDLILVKRHRGESWPALERGDQALGYGLTFGRKLDA